MVRISTENAVSAGLSDASGATGFGEEPPFPESGEEPFDLVLTQDFLAVVNDNLASNELELHFWRL